VADRLERIERIKVCLNGQRSRAEHPAVPVTPAEVAAAAAGAVAAGAEAVHVHPRRSEGSESLLADDVAATVAEVRRACPEMPVGVSTGLWISGGDHRLRQAIVAGWADLPAPARPDFASVNVSEPGFVELVGLLHASGIGVEAGVWTASDAESLAASAPRAGWLRILVEVIDAPAAGAVAAADTILRRLDELGVTAPRLLHGEDAACWPLVAHAGRLGLPTRIGLEDTLAGPRGERIGDNAELVRLALARWTAAGRQP
jgi:uncharacterized protein (DUF849 family)